MGKIFYLMGKSASGKDTIYQELMRDRDLDLKSIVLYTTRPIRDGEQEGIDYHFITEEEVQDLQRSGHIIEMRTYETVYGPWRYLTVDDEQIDLEGNDYIVIGTLESFLKVKAYFGQEKVVPIYVYLDDGKRLEWALQREKKQTRPRYGEMCRRFLADEKDFSEENLLACGIVCRQPGKNGTEERCYSPSAFYNDNSQNCKERIKKFIQSFLHRQ